MQGEWSRQGYANQIYLPIAATSIGAITILFTDGLKKRVTIRDVNGTVVGTFDNCGTRHHLHVLGPAGQPYTITPEYFTGNCGNPGAANPLTLIAETSDDRYTNGDYVTHRKFATTADPGNNEKAVIMILIEDNDFGPDIGFMAPGGRRSSPTEPLPIPVPPDDSDRFEQTY